jgi:hypothetical protein
MPGESAKKQADREAGRVDDEKKNPANPTAKHEQPNPQDKQNPQHETGHERPENRGQNNPGQNPGQHNPGQHNPGQHNPGQTGGQGQGGQRQEFPSTSDVGQKHQPGSQPGDEPRRQDSGKSDSGRDRNRSESEHDQHQGTQQRR